MWAISHYVPPPVSVASSTATNQTWQSYVSSIGTLTAVNGEDLSAEVPGTVTEIRIHSGQYVNQGDILLLLNTSIEQAELKDNQAKIKLAEINFDRDSILFKKNVLSKASLDTSLAQLEEAIAG